MNTTTQPPAYVGCIAHPTHTELAWRTRDTTHMHCLPSAQASDLLQTLHARMPVLVLPLLDQPASYPHLADLYTAHLPFRALSRCQLRHIAHQHGMQPLPPTPLLLADLAAAHALTPWQPASATEFTSLLHAYRNAHRHGTQRDLRRLERALRQMLLTDAALPTQQPRIQRQARAFARQLARPIVAGVLAASLGLSPLVPHPLHAADVAPFQVNSTTEGTQSRPAVASAANGTYTVVWQGPADGSDIFARRFDVNGDALVDEFRVNDSTTTGDQRNPAVAVAGTGSSVIVWEGPDANGTGIFGQRYAADGSAAGSEFAINTTTANIQNTPAVAMDDDGDFVVVWTSFDQDGERGGIYAQRFDAAGVAQGSEFRVNTTTAGGQLNPAVAMDSDGDFVIAWTSSGQDGSGYGVYAQRYNAAGAAQGSEFLVPQTTAGSQTNASVALDEDGDFLIAWDTAGQDSSANAIYARRFNADGTPRTPEFQVNTTENGDERDPSVALRPNGEAFIAWQGNPARNGVFAQRISPGNRNFGGEQVVIASGATSTDRVAAALGDDGAAVVVWAGSLTGGDSNGIIARQYAPVPIQSPTITTSAGNVSYTEGDPAITLDTAIVLTSPNGNTINNATIQLTPFVSNQDVLSATVQAGITALLQPEQGTLVLNGTAPITTYQTVLRSATYRNTSIAPDTTPRTATFTIDDGVEFGSATRNITIIDVNTPPQISTAPGAAQYTENDPPAVIDASLLITDTDNTELVSATVVISSGLEADSDILSVLAEPPASGITITYQAATGQLRLRGTAPASEYQRVLRTVAYKTSSDTPATTPRLIAFTIDDGRATATASRALNVTAANDAPQITLPPGVLIYPAGSPPLPIAPQLILNDPDSATIASAEVQITNYVADEDVLSGTNQLSITVSFDAQEGTLNLQGTAPISAYQQLLRQITYENTHPAPDSTPRTLRFLVSDDQATGEAKKQLVPLLVSSGAPPQIFVSSTEVDYTEQEPPLVLAPDLTLFDAGTDVISNATVQLQLNYRPDQDLLAIDSLIGTSGITPSFNSVSGTLNLTGTASITDYQTLLRRVTYVNTSLDPNTALRRVRYTVSNTATGEITIDLRVNAINNPPILSGSTDPLTYTEGAPPLLLVPDLTITDPDSDTLAALSVQLSAGYASGEDQLEVLSDTLGLETSFDTDSGTLIISGTAAISTYQTLARSVAYRNTSGNPVTLPRTVLVTARDESTTGTLQRSLRVVRQNTDPTIVVATGPLSYEEGDPPVAVDNSLTISDPDSNTLTSASVTISAGYVNGEDRLAITLQGGISGTFDAASGQIALSGTAPISTYQAVLRSVTYVNSSSEPTAGNRSVTFIVSNEAGSGQASRTINVINTSIPPQIRTTVSDLVYTEGSGAVPVDPGVTVSDGDSESLVGATVAIDQNYQQGQDVLSFADTETISGTFNAGTGTLTLSGAATPAEYQAALRTVRYTNTSSDPNTSVRRVRFTVNDGSNQASATRFMRVNAEADRISNLIVTLVAEAQFGAQLAALEVPPGASIRYTAAVTNTGPDRASSITLTITLPPAITPSSPNTIGAGSGWTCAYTPETGVVRCTLPELQLTGAPVLQFTATVSDTTSGTLTTRATVTSRTSPPGSNPGSEASEEIIVAEPDPINRVYLPLIRRADR